MMSVADFLGPDYEVEELDPSQRPAWAELPAGYDDQLLMWKVTHRGVTKLGVQVALAPSEDLHRQVALQFKVAFQVKHKHR